MRRSPIFRIDVQARGSAMRGIRSILSLCWLFMLLAAAAATAPVRADTPVLRLAEEQGANGPINLTPYWTVLEDPRQQWTIKDVTSATMASRFNAPRQDKGSLNFGFRTRSVWLRITMQNTATRALERQLEIAFPPLHQVEFYVPNDAGFERMVSGHARIFEDRPLAHRNFVFPVNLPTGSQSTFYLRVVSDTTIEIPARLWTPQAFAQNSLHEYMGQALYFGMLLALGLYNFLLYASMRDRTYLYYVLFVVSNALALIGYNGMGFQFFWPHSPAWSVIASLIGFASTGLTMLLFQRQLLATATTVPLLDRVMRVFIGLNLLQIVGFAALPFRIMVVPGLALDALNMLLALAVGLVCWRRRQASAGYFLLAFGSFLIATVLIDARSFGVPLPGLFAVYGLEIGSSLEMLLLSLALADRFRRMRQEKETAQEQLVESLKRSERVLEQKVAERTAQLTQTNAELLEHERALEAARQVAEDASRMKSEFLANMSHEIRTPMHAIIGMAYLALRTELGTAQRNYVEKIHGAARSLLGIVNDILDISKIEAGRLEIEETAFSLNDVLGNVITVTSQAAFDKQLDYAVELASETPVDLIGDPLRLSQVLVNLVGNAIKFTEAGRVRLECAPVQIAGKTVEIRFCVSDTGIGLSPAQQSRLFQAFSQADSSTTRKHGGTGLGLSISWKLVQAMGGTLIVESELGVGACFAFSLRFGLASALGHAVDACQSTTSTTSNLHAVPHRGRLQVLLVEPNDAGDGSVLDDLAPAGLELTIARSGPQAMAAIFAADTARAFDVVLVDADLPGMSGLELAAEIAVADLIHTPACVLLASAMDDDLAGARKHPAIAAVLTRPVSAARLREALRHPRTGPNADTDATPAHAQLGKVQGQVHAQQHARSALPDLRNCRVLLVEDNDINRQIAVEMLAAAGVHTDVAVNGRLALELLFAEEPETWDLVLIDLQMPELGGLATARRLRADPRFDGLPIIAMTAHVTADEVARCRQSGMQDHIGKPIDPDQFYNTVARWLPVPHAPGRLERHRENGTGMGTGMGTSTGKAAAASLAAFAAGNDASARHSSTALVPAIEGFDTDAALDRLDGDVAMYKLLLRAMQPTLEQAIADIDRLRGARRGVGGDGSDGCNSDAGNDDQQSLEQLAHNIHGMAANLGADKLAKAARHLERSLKFGSDGISPGISGAAAIARTQEEDVFRHTLAETLRAVSRI